jgi:signal transduction histidine kinase
MPERGRHAPRVRHSLRRRVALAFAAGVVVTALALALSAYFVTKTAQDDEALDKALAQSRFNLFLTDSMLPATPETADYDRLLDALQIRGDFATLIEAGPDIYVSGPQVTQDLITQELADKVAEGRIGFQSIRMAGESTIAVGGQVRSSDLALYFFYPQGARLTELARLRNILMIAGAVLAVLGAIAGYWLARRLLGPVRAASKAAVRMSQGDLDIRLPVGADEFGILAASFNRMAENLQTKMLDLEAGQARERRFVADVTHELRTPVSALVGEASLLKAQLEANPSGSQPEVSRLSMLVSTDIARLRQLVDDLLEVSRLDARAAETVIESVDLQAFLAQLAKAHGWSDAVRIAIAPAAGIGRRRPLMPAETATVDRAEAWDTSDYAVRTDKRRVERIVVNLVENALRHGAAPVEIEITRTVASDVAEPAPAGPATAGVTTAEATFVPIHAESGTAAPAAGALVQVAVTDSGPGIPAEHLPHVFERFYKADPSRSSSRGSGLGLAIARENARLLGGDLTVANVPGRGARFVLTLPASD